jgi:UDP-N-acetylmuramoyl-L-alanyl-D-glutamate--2,6-diaminopimelate ligase
VEADGLGSAFLLTCPDGALLRARTGLPGSFNVSNAALALAMVIESGRSASAVQAALDAHEDALTPQVPGRMQVVHHNPTAVVDFAHNPDALVRSLDSLEAGDGKRIVVFGATGERDTTKRPIMGRLAAEHADVVIITDDDPHDEEPSGIRRDVMEGALQAGTAARVIEVAPRAEAIAESVRLAGPQDVILVAGRGHEVYQEVNGVNLALDDREELLKAFAERDGSAPTASAE